MKDQSVLCITETPTHPEIAGNRTRIVTLLNHFKTHGFVISVIYLQNDHRDVETSYDEMNRYWEGRVRFLRCHDTRSREDTLSVTLEEIESPDIVLLSYPFHSRLLNLFPDTCFKIIDTMDVFYRRNKLLQEHGINVTCGSADFATQELEHNALKKADCILAIQHEDYHYYSETHQLPTYLLEHAPGALSPPREKSLTKKLLFIASRSYVGKRNVMRFLEEFWPYIKKRNEKVELIIAGDVQTLLPEVLDSQTTMIGRVEKLSSLYDSIDIAVSGEVFATGLSIKNITALSYGIPLVTTTAGARGIRGAAEKALFIANDPRTFAETIYSLLSDEKLYSETSIAALAYSMDSYEKAHETVRTIYNKATDVKCNE